MFMFFQEGKRIKKYFCIFNFFFFILQMHLISPTRFPSKDKGTLFVFHVHKIRSFTRVSLQPNSANASFQNIAGGDIRSNYPARRLLKKQSIRYVI